MANKRVLTNKHFGWFYALASSVADITAITKTEAASFVNISDAAKLDGTDFNTKASKSEDDRSFADGANAKAAGYADASGNLSGYKAADDDTASSYYKAETGIKPQGSDIILLNRPVESTSSDLAAGDEYNAYHVLSDGPSDVRGSASYSWTAAMLLQSDMQVRGIIAPDTPVAVTVDVAAGSLTGSTGDAARLKATYQGKVITVGAKWVSSDPTVATVSEHGVVEMVGTGSADITASFPGATESDPQSVTVS